MNFDSFGCERRFIENVFRATQRNLLIREYCSDNFGYFNMVDIYYRSFSENAILIFLIICTVYPLLFMSIAIVADKYLSVGMSDLSKRFNLSPTLAAVTLIAFANGAPDVLAALSSSGKSNGAFISLGALFGAFIFSCCLVVSNVALNAKGDIALPRLAVTKELGFYLFSVFVVIIFGLIRKSGWPFIICYLTLYFIYIGVTLYLERFNKKEDAELQLERADNEVGAAPTDAPTDAPGDNADKPKGLFAGLAAEVVEEDGGFLDNLVGVPLKTAGVFTVSYLENPLVQTPLKYLVVSSSVAFMLFTLELVSAPLAVLALIGLVFGATVLVLDLTKLNPNVSAIITELISVFAAIGWIKIFSTIIIDFISFLAFYFSINEIILSSLLLSAGNTIGDFFGNGALSKGGEEVMGAMASYSGQIFNNFIGFSFNMLSGALSDKTEFDIFAIDYWKQETDEPLKAPVGNYFLIAVICFVIGVIALKFVFFTFSKFVLKKAFVNVLFAIYGVFFVSSLAFGILSRN